MGPSGLQHSRTLQYTDNVTWVKGKHTAKFGMDWRTVSYARINNFGASDEFGSLNFRGNFSGNAFADLLLGLPATNLVFAIGPPIDQRSQHFADLCAGRMAPSEKFDIKLRIEVGTAAAFLGKERQHRQFQSEQWRHGISRHRREGPATRSSSAVSN